MTYIQLTRQVLAELGYTSRSRAWELADSRLTECAVNQRDSPRQFAQSLRDDSVRRGRRIS